MTVAELIEHLKTLPLDALVSTHDHGWVEDVAPDDFALSFDGRVYIK